jgi:8-amino-7-oxononanoate synthase
MPVTTHIDLFQKCIEYSAAREARAAGYYPYFQPIAESADTEVEIRGQRLIMVGSNNYLGLTHDPRIIAAAEAASRKYGTGCTGSRFLNGTLDLHEKLEASLAAFTGKEAALVFSTGYQANLGCISALVGSGDYIVIDKLDHASILDGCRLSSGHCLRFRHKDMSDLERILSRFAGKGAGALVVVDGVFSMEGDIVDLPAVIEVARKYGARVLCDDAHSFGVLGKTGAGTAEHFGVQKELDLVMGTFSKSFASCGGFIAGDALVIDYMRHHARSLIFSASMPPYAVATVQAALEIILNEPERRERLWTIARRMIDGFTSMGYDVGEAETPIVPLVIGDRMKTFALWRALFDAGIFTNPVVSPAVPEASCRLRTSYIATHTDAQLDYVLEIAKKSGRALGII